MNDLRGSLTLPCPSDEKIPLEAVKQEELREPIRDHTPLQQAAPPSVSIVVMNIRPGPGATALGDTPKLPAPGWRAEHIPEAVSTISTIRVPLCFWDFSSYMYPRNFLQFTLVYKMFLTP